MATPRVPVTDVTKAEPASYGILSPAVTVVEDSDQRWSSGFDYESLDCGTTVKISSICSSVSGVSAIQGDSNDRWRGTYPFSIETEFQCSTMGSMGYEEIAEERLLACQQKAIEQEFWTGRLAKLEQAARDAAGDEDLPNRYLASSSATDVTPTPGTGVKPKYGLALLEEALGNCGCGVRGTVHMTRSIASSLAPKAVDGALLTPLDNTIVAGTGYTGSGPNGSMPAGNLRWMYATGPLTVRLGPVTAIPGNTRQATDIARNNVLVKADRPAAVTWDTCCHFAVLVDLAADYS